MAVGGPAEVGGKVPPIATGGRVWIGHQPGYVNFAMATNAQHIEPT